MPRVKHQLSTDHVSVVAAGVAFYGLLAVVPALAAVVSIFGLVANPADARALLDNLRGAIPAEAQEVIGQQLQALVSHSSTALSLGAVAGIVLALWSAAKGSTALMAALNIVYHEQERRGLFRRYLTALTLTLGAVIGVVVGLVLIVVIPAVLHFVGFGSRISATLISLVRWPLLFFALLFALAIVYRFAPSREQPRWRWVTRGSVLAALLWIVGSVLFSMYVSRFGSYDKTYGSLGAVVILLVWFYLTAYVVLLGAELDAEMEHQTAVDSTGEPAPLGERGAHVADTIGETP